ncbi:hypothetical protein WDW89_07960 [Deltaproteobacteria bacterium TL4]
MTQTEEKIQKYQERLGIDASTRFERHVTSAVLELSESLKHNFLDNDSKVDYATHVFAKTLDDFAEILERGVYLN